LTGLSIVSREEILLEEWKAAEETIRNLDSILTNIRFYGSTAAIALMSAAAETLRSREAAIGIFSLRFHVAIFIQLLTAVLIVVLWMIHAQYFAFLGLVVVRQREIEEKDLLIQGKDVLRLGRNVTREQLPFLIRGNPWNYLYASLLVLAIVLAVVYALIPLN
jgi:hypothetical protein